MSKQTKFQKKAEKAVNALRDLINSELKDDGNTEATSQHIVLINRLNELERAINSTEPSDFLD